MFSSFFYFLFLLFFDELDGNDPSSPLKAELETEMESLVNEYKVKIHEVCVSTVFLSLFFFLPSLPTPLHLLSFFSSFFLPFFFLFLFPFFSHFFLPCIDLWTPIPSRFPRTPRPPRVPLGLPDPLRRPAPVTPCQPPGSCQNLLRGHLQPAGLLSPHHHLPA